MSRYDIVKKITEKGVNRIGTADLPKFTENNSDIVINNYLDIEKFRSEKINKILRKTLSTDSPQSARYWIVGCFVNEKSIGSTNGARTPRSCGSCEDRAYDDARTHG